MGLYHRILALPWVYEKLRIFLLGGGPGEDIHEWLNLTEDDVLIDVGCGPGLSLEYLPAFQSYHGFDTDEAALRRFRDLRSRDNVLLYAKSLSTEDLDNIRPSKGLLKGIMHHLSDDDARDLFSMLGRCASIQVIVTLDPVRLRGRRLNNLLCALDRGRYVRSEEHYRRLIESTPFTIVKSPILCSGNGAASYFCMLLVRSDGHGADKPA